MPAKKTTADAVEIPAHGLSSHEAEFAVVAALIANPDAFDEVADKLSVDDFSHAAARAVFSAVTAVEVAGRPVDKVTVLEELRRQKNLTKVGGANGIDDLLSKHTSAVAHLSSHVAIIEDKAKLRNALAAGRTICDHAIAEGAVADDVVETAEQAVFGLGARDGRSTLIPMAKAVPGILEEVARGRNSVLTGCSTGIDDLDEMTGGMQPGQLWIVAARPGVGKSALSLQMAAHVASTTGNVVPFLSYEMSVNELGMRLLSSMSSVSMTSLRQGNIPAHKERDIAIAAEKLAALPLHIDDNPPSTIAGVRSQIRRLSRRTELSVVFVDYLQLLESDRRTNSNRNDEVSDISRGLKQLAQSTGTCIVAVSQLNRSVEMRGGNKRPQLSDLRDSGAVEQDANCILFVYRESLVNPSADPRLTELIIGKQRSGPTGSVFVEFDGATATFTATSRRSVTAAQPQRAASNIAPF